MASAEPTPESIPLHRQMADVGVLVELTTEVMQLQAGALGIALTIKIDNDVPDRVSIDRGKVAWAITSLVGSALRHLHGPAGAVTLHVSFDPADATLRLSVRDNGRGISAARLARLLQREHWHPGGALALLLVQDIAVAHGGRMEIESQAGSDDHFTEVTLTIPTRVS